MKIPKLKMPFMMFPTIFLPLVMNATEDHPGLLAAYVIFQGVWLGWMIASIVSDGEYIGSGKTRAEKRRELIAQRTRELEEELGIKPLDFSDLPDGADHELKKEL